VPPNTTAEVHVPTTDPRLRGPQDGLRQDKLAPAGVTESGGPAESSKGVTFLRRDGDRMVYNVGSGEYEFISRF